MAVSQKFLFERTFEEPDEPVEAPAPEEPEEPVEPEIVAPTFSEEEIEAARQQGFAGGREAGLAEAAGSIEKQTAETLGRIEQSLPDIFQSLTEIRENSAQMGISVAAAMARKLLPDMALRNALGEFERMIAEVLVRILEEPRLTVRLNAEMAGMIEGKMESMLADKGFAGKVAVLIDPEMAAGDCRLEWANGGAIRDMSALWREIDAIIAGNLGSEALDFARPEPAPPPPTNDKPVVSKEEIDPEADSGQDPGPPRADSDNQVFVAPPGIGDNDAGMIAEEVASAIDAAPQPILNGEGEGDEHGTAEQAPNA